MSAERVRLEKAAAPMADRLRAVIGCMSELSIRDAIDTAYPCDDDPETSFLTDLAFVLAALDQALAAGDRHG